MDLKFEGVDLEYKKAKNNLPESFWETYSAFANTNGGKIILGIDEKNIDTFPKLLGSFFSWTTKELMGIIFFNNFPTVHKNNMMGYISSKTYLIKLIKNSI